MQLWLVHAYCVRGEHKKTFDAAGKYFQLLGYDEVKLGSNPIVLHPSKHAVNTSESISVLKLVSHSKAVTGQSDAAGQATNIGKKVYSVLNGVMNGYGKYMGSV